MNSLFSTIKVLKFQAMKKSELVFFLLINSGFLFSQNIFEEGNREFSSQLGGFNIHYSIENHTSNFEVESLKTGNKDFSGDITVAFEGIPERFGSPILFGGHYVQYQENTPYWCEGFGSRSYDVYYRIMDNELNGLHYINGIEYPSCEWVYKQNYFVAIAGNIVDASSAGSMGWEKMANKWVYEYTMWQLTGLKIEAYDFPFPTPEVHGDELYYDLEEMVQIFLKDYEAHLIEFTKTQANWQQSDDEYERFLSDVFLPVHLILEECQVVATFEKLDPGVIAESYGIDNDQNIVIKVDPDQWMDADYANRWYILYHELGHDVLNFRHGEGGRMMFNYPTKNYSWEEFFKDRSNMFLKALNKKYPYAVKNDIQPLWGLGY